MNLCIGQPSLSADKRQMLLRAAQDHLSEFRTLIVIGEMDNGNFFFQGAHAPEAEYSYFMFLGLLEAAKGVLLADQMRLDAAMADDGGNSLEEIIASMPAEV